MSAVLYLMFDLSAGLTARSIFVDADYNTLGTTGDSQYGLFEDGEASNRFRLNGFSLQQPVVHPTPL